MTTITKTFCSADGQAVGAISAQLDFTSARRRITLSLSGVIVGQNAIALREFLRDISCFPADSWHLDIKHLRTMSQRGFRALGILATVLGRRGQAITIIEASRVVLAVMHETKMIEAFKVRLQRASKRVSSREIFEINPGEPIGQA